MIVRVRAPELAGSPRQLRALLSASRWERACKLCEEPVLVIDFAGLVAATEAFLQELVVAALVERPSAGLVVSGLCPGSEEDRMLWRALLAHRVHDRCERI